MAEKSYFWAGTVTGDASLAPYSDDLFSDLYKIMFVTNNTTQGVIRAYLNQLQITGATSPLSMNTGAAIVDGKLYINDAALSIAVPTPSASTRQDRLVLRKSFASQTIRLTRIAGAEGGGLPAITQSDGITWDILLYNLSITTLGAITLTDARTFCVTPLETVNPTVDVQVFSVAGASVWTKPTNAKIVEVICIGAGGGGASGMSKAAALTRTGGSGGGGGARKRRIFRASLLGATEAVTVGTGGPGGTPVTNGNGNDGTAGANTTFGSWVTAFAGGKGIGGTNSGSGSGGGGGGSAGIGGAGQALASSAGGLPETTAGADGLGGGGGGSTNGTGGGGRAEDGGGGGGSWNSAGAQGPGGGSVWGGGGGGTGASYDPSNNNRAATDGGAQRLWQQGGGGALGASGVSGSPGTDGAAGNEDYGGAGGGGGGGGSNGAGAKGGDGGAPGGGGGGGGAATGITNASGAGGKGGDGLCVVITYF